MKILIDLICNPAAIYNIDYRYEIFKQLMPIWKNNGHEIYIDKVKNCRIESSILNTYNVYNETKDKDTIELYICFGIYKEGIKRHKYFIDKNIKCATYDHSWLPSSVLFERQKLFNDSFFWKSLNEEINKNYVEKDADEYIKQLITQNSSKRPQHKRENIPEHIKDKYVFIPFQKSNDISLIHYSKHTMFDFVKTVVNFCKEKDIPVVMKIHPHVQCDEKQNAQQCFQECKNIYSECYLIDTSIYDCMKYSRFTACLNSGSLIDNFITQTPVLSCAHSMFSNVECMVFDENIINGLNKIMNQEYQIKIIQENQKKIVYWLKYTLLYSYLKPMENKERFDYLVGLVL